MTLYIIDGYNVLHALMKSEGRGDGQALNDLERERQRLVDQLTSYMAGTADRAIAVFDSKRARLERAETVSRNVEVYFGSFARSADSIIERVAYRLREDETVIVISSDYVLQQTVFSPNQGRFPVVRQSSAQFVSDLRKTARTIASTKTGPGDSQRVEDRLDPETLQRLRSLRDDLEDGEA